MYFAEGTDHPFVLKPHWHDAIEIIHLVKGDYLCAFNTNSFRLKEEVFCFLGGGALHSMNCQKDYVEEALLFDPALLSSAFMDESAREILDPLRRGSLRLPLLVRGADKAFAPLQEVYGKIRSAFQCYGVEKGDQRLVHDPASQLRIKAGLLEILAILAQSGELSQADGVLDPRLESLKKVMTYIRDNYREKIYLHDLALIMNMNEQYFCRFFRKATGKTPIAYINEQRIREASLLLAGTQDPVPAVAASCGFGNQGYFIKTFKKIVGCSPLEYRKGLSQ